MKYSLTGLLAPLAALMIAAPGHAGTKAPPCGCDDLATVEQQLRDQEFLYGLFSEWSGYLPGSILTTADMQERAVTLLQLTFYGVKSQAPQKDTSGARADLGTILTDASCPIVLYHYKDGKPVMVPKNPIPKGQKPPPDVELVQETSPITEDKYEPNGQCAALVHYTFAHERQHVASCKAQFAANKVDQWARPQFFAADDAKAYKAGIDVLRAERDKLRRQCPKKSDAKWRGELIYGYAYINNGSEVIKKGDDVVYKQGTGHKEWGDHRSARLHAWINATELNGEMKIAYDASSEKNIFDRGHFEILKEECGWYRKVDYVTEHSNEEMESGAYQGLADGFVTLYGQHLQVGLETEKLKGKSQKREWLIRDGHCNKKNDFKRNDSRAEDRDLDAIRVSLDAEVDPDHPNDINVTKVIKGMGGKEQTYIELRLHREAP